MSSFINRSCKSCRERQEELLECGAGTQIVCLCYDDLNDEEILQLENGDGSADEPTADIDGVCAEIDEPTTSDEYVVANPSTQSSADNVLLCTTPNNEAVGKSKQPPAIKRKPNDSSKLSAVSFQPPIKKRLFPADDEFNTCLKSSSTIRK